MFGKNVNFGNNSGNIGDSYVFNSGSELSEVSKILAQIQSAVNQMSGTAEEKEEAKDCLDVIKEESAQKEPRKHYLKTACNNLKRIISDPTLWNLVDKFSSLILKKM